MTLTKDKVETTVRCSSNSAYDSYVSVGTSLVSGKVRVTLYGGASGTTRERQATIKGQITEYIAFT